MRGYLFNWVSAEVIGKSSSQEELVGFNYYSNASDLIQTRFGSLINDLNSEAERRLNGMKHLDEN